MESLRVAARARLSVVQMTSAAKAAHTGSSLSLVDLLSVLYVDVANVSESNEHNKDMILISKGHAAAGVYAVMAHAGMFPTSLLDSYCKDGSELGGHVTKNARLKVPFSSGSLGHALPFGVGLALDSRLKGQNSKTFVVISDGECDEGSNWEAALLAAHLELGNLTVLIDRNGLQSLGPTEETVRLEPLREKWSAFGWKVKNVNGHNHEALSMALTTAPLDRAQPTLVICETIKGYGVSFMENSVLWHYKPPADEYLVQALAQLEARL